MSAGAASVRRESQSGGRRSGPVVRRASPGLIAEGAPAGQSRKARLRRERPHSPEGAGVAPQSGGRVEGVPVAVSN